MFHSVDAEKLFTQILSLPDESHNHNVDEPFSTYLPGETERCLVEQGRRCWENLVRILHIRRYARNRSQPRKNSCEVLPSTSTTSEFIAKSSPKWKKTLKEEYTKLQLVTTFQITSVTRSWMEWTVRSTKKLSENLKKVPERSFMEGPSLSNVKTLQSI